MLSEDTAVLQKVIRAMGWTTDMWEQLNIQFGVLFNPLENGMHFDALLSRLYELGWEVEIVFKRKDTPYKAECTLLFNGSVKARNLSNSYKYALCYAVAEVADYMIDV